MAQDIPAPPEADVIRLARLAGRLSVEDAVTGVRAAGGQISATYWRDIERGHGGRRGRRVPARASEGLLAQMARAVGVQPDQLTRAGRDDAARVLAEIMRREAPPQPPLLPMARDLALSAGVNPDDPDDRYIKSVRDDLTRAILKHGPSPSGEQVFRGRPGSGYEAALWDDPGIDDRSKEVSIAALRAMRDQHGQGRRRRTG